MHDVRDEHATDGRAMLEAEKLENDPSLEVTTIAIGAGSPECMYAPPLRRYINSLEGHRGVKKIDSVSKPGHGH
jgi:hypothetical protein